jgi:hypothetical protein
VQAIKDKLKLHENNLKDAPLETKNPLKGRPFAKYVCAGDLSDGFRCSNGTGTKWGLRGPKNFQANKAAGAPPKHKQITQLERKKLEEMIALLKAEIGEIGAVKKWDTVIRANVEACRIEDGP